MTVLQFPNRRLRRAEAAAAVDELFPDIIGEGQVAGNAMMDPDDFRDSDFVEALFAKFMVCVGCNTYQLRVAAPVCVSCTVNEQTRKNVQ